MLDAFPNRSAWYDRYFDYLAAARLLPNGFADSPDCFATREQALQMIALMVRGRLSSINQVSAIPDFDGENYQNILSLYQAGILRGNDDYGSFEADRPILRCELAAMVSRILEPSLRLKFTLKPPPTTVFSLGKSGGGRDLTCYRIGNGNRALVLTFAMHGWEDNFSRDGQMLVDTAYLLIDSLNQNPQNRKNWSIYIVPLCNPDGLAEGNSHDGKGRLTLYSYNQSGTLISKGIDLNRCFPYRFSPLTDPRNYNGPAPLSAPEARALNNLLLQVKAEHSERYFVDVHGWYQQIFVSDNENALAKAFLTYFPQNKREKLGGSGYISNYAKALGYHAALFEFPADVHSPEDFRNKGYAQKFIQAIYKLLEI